MMKTAYLSNGIRIKGTVQSHAMIRHIELRLFTFNIFQRFKAPLRKQMKGAASVNGINRMPKVPLLDVHGQETGPFVFHGVPFHTFRREWDFQHVVFFAQIHNVLSKPFLDKLFKRLYVPLPLFLIGKNPLHSQISP